MDLAILSSRIFTADPRRPWAQALHVSGNTVTCVGSNDEVRPHIGNRTEVLELPGRLITPGMVDAHTHFISLGMSFQRVDLNNLDSLQACREKIRQAAESCPPGKWLVGRGWDHNKWREGREPTRRDLDDIVSGNPAMMIRTCGHTIWVNSLALQQAGIDGRTPDPEGGKIERDTGTGEPSGLIREARRLLEKHIPKPSLEEKKKAALAGQEAALRVGITGVHSCEELEQWEVLDELDRAGRLKLRVYHLLPADQLEAAADRSIKPGYGSERLWFGHAKLFADGSLGSGTALLHEPYADDASNFGLAFLSPEILQQKIDLAYRLGWDVAIHAIGDKAVTNALDAIACVRDRYPGSRRDRIEHVQLFQPRDLNRFREMGVVASVQPVFVPTDWSPATCHWGADRCENAYAWRSLLGAGVALQFGSDAPVEPNNPLYGLHAAVTREDRQGRPAGGWCPDQRLTLEESLVGYCRVAAWTAGKEQVLGALAPGKWADLSVFGADLFEMPPEQWLRTAVEMTVVGGEIVYRAP
jgi:predicted amidohydrolase YtcJ